MLNKIFLVAALCVSIKIHAQYKNDNVLFKTVEWINLCQQLKQNPGYLLLDVRTTEEYNDSSDYINAGRLKGAINMSSGVIAKRLSEIKNYKSMPVFVYCSHSQRSRRVSKMLADSGFTKVHNINGGITALYYSNAKDDPCLQQMIVTNNKYHIISASDLCKKMDTHENIFVLDVRSDSAFNHRSLMESDNAIGTIRNAVNIPLKDLQQKTGSIPKDKEIIVTDKSSFEAAKAAVMLSETGFKNVSVLIEGIERWITEEGNESFCIKKWYVHTASYQLVTVQAFEKEAMAEKSLVLDVRTADEFANRHKDYWRNTGHVKNAMNIPVADIAGQLDKLADYKNRPVLLYDFSGDEEVYKATAILTRNGFTNVQVLMGGIFNIRWTAANRNQPALNKLVVDIPVANL